MKVAMSRQDVDHDGLELPDVRALQLFYRWDTSIKACTAAAFGHSYSFINLENLDKERAPQPGITPHHLVQFWSCLRKPDCLSTISFHQLYCFMLLQQGGKGCDEHA
eukprot:scaffold294847_cov13-Tisochrysis_lutea.AAC.1